MCGPQCCLREEERRGRRRSVLSLVREVEREDHEARTETLILQRGSMRHLTDWFYPDGGWGWNILLAAVLLHLLALGPLLGGGHVLPLLLATRLSTSPTTSSLLPVLCLSSSLLVTPLAASVVRRYSARLPAAIGGLMLALGWLFASFSVQTHQVYNTHPFWSPFTLPIV